MTKAKRYRG